MAERAWWQNRWAIILMHILGWVLFFSIPILFTFNLSGKPGGMVFSLPNALFPSGSGRFLWADLFIHVLMIGGFYANVYLFTPLLLNRRKVLAFTASHIGMALLVVLTFNFLPLFPEGSLPPIPTDFMPAGPNMRRLKFRPPFLFPLFSYFFIVAVSTSVRLIIDRLRAERLAKNRENETLRSELSFLRSQVSPHFMFNVLNSLVSMARSRQYDLEPYLIKLSGLLRYMLYSTDQKKVSLQREIDYLRSYIELQQLRFGSTIPIKHSLMISTEELHIEPMLLIPFVENAFKHGTQLINDPGIGINLLLIDHTLYFKVSNRYDPIASNNAKETSGIGLNNVSRRLKLLYPDTHELLIDKNDESFIVYLQLNLAR